MSEPDWLRWTREMQAISQTGLAFSHDPYDRERYAALRALASAMMAAQCDTPASRIDDLFAQETGYATPKIDVRGAVFDDAGNILMVREILDGNRWTLPGGWADVNMTTAASAAKEVREESGYEVVVRKLAAVWDRSRQGHTPALFSSIKMFYLCGLVGGEPAISLETSEIGWFAEDKIPQDLSFGRILPHQVARMFAHAREPSLATEFE